ncbi:MAG TPA: response regulator transcription factor [Bryobacteraceae bacterium]|nr:response regulator transcription factor [Bryobacteraceae bacterium]
MKRKTVLIADDHEEWREMIASLLEPGFEIAGYAERGDEVCARARELTPDLVILAASMQGISGFTVLTELRSLLRNACIVMVTLTTGTMYERVAYQRGADGWVAKWDVFAELVPVVEYGLAQAAARQLQVVGEGVV